MKKVFRIIRNIIFIVIILGFVTAIFDYLRMSNGMIPVFSIKSYNEKNRIETFRGLFYVAKRKVKNSTKESLIDSTNMKFQLITFDLKVPKQYRKEFLNFQIETTETSDCDGISKLYFADKNIKVYTYCLDNIVVKENNKNTELLKYLEKDSSNFIDDIDYHLAYTGLYGETTTLMLESRNDSFTNNGLKMYRCNKENINDVYIGPLNMTYMLDFCTYKDDDFKFMYEVVDESVEPDEKQVEVFYEDETYRYEFDYLKSDFVFIVTPAVRGKQEVKIPLKIILANKILTIDELEKKGLKFNKIDKAKELEEKQNNSNIGQGNNGESN